jgi:hypothetical protein
MGHGAVPVSSRKTKAKLIAPPAAANKRENGDQAPRDLAAEFASESLDHHDGSIVSNPIMWQAWVTFCARRKVDPGTKKGLQARLKNYAVYDNNNNRPRYVGVRLKTIRLAVSN